MSTPPYEYLSNTGVIVPDTTDILSGVQTEFQTVFGSDLIVTPDTPQGVLITAEALARAEVVNNNAALANQINPNVAGGVFLDAIMALTGVQRTAQTQTLVTNVTLTGIAGTVIPAGSQAQTSVGDVFQSLSTVILSAGGTAIVNFSSVAYGAIPCSVSAAALDQVVSSVLGWETVTNNAIGHRRPRSPRSARRRKADQAACGLLRLNTLSLQRHFTRRGDYLGQLYNVPKA